MSMLGSTSASASNSNNLICGYPIRHGAVIGGQHVKHRAQAQSQAQQLAGAQSNPEFKETKCISLEWKLSGLKNLFESSRGDVKSRCIKSAPFGEGKWEIFFYANSVVRHNALIRVLLPCSMMNQGSDYVSLYLSAEPTAEERERGHVQAVKKPSSAMPLASPYAAASSSATGIKSSQVQQQQLQQQQQQQSGGNTSGAAGGLTWVRDGSFGFSLEIRGIGNKETPIKTMEAADHIFSSEARNWGWQSFARRSDVYFNNSLVKHHDAFIVACTVTYTPTVPTPSPHNDLHRKMLPVELLNAFSGLFDDPDYSDVQFIIKSRSQTTGKKRQRSLYAIKRILAARSEYFAVMFSSGFSEDSHVLPSSDNTSSTAKSKAPQANEAMEEDDHAESSDDFSDSTLESDDEVMQFESDASEQSEMGEEDGLQQERSERVPADKDVSKTVEEDYDEDEEEEDASDDEGESDDEEGDDEEQVTAHSSIDSYNASKLSKDQATSLSSIESAKGKNSNHNDALAASERENSMALDDESTEPYQDNNTSKPLRRPKDALGLSTMRSVSTILSPSKVAPAPAQPERAAKKQKKNARAADPANKKRVVVVVRDAAYATYRALLYFLYTDTITFSPLSSTYTHEKDTAEALNVAFPFASRRAYYNALYPRLHNNGASPDQAASSKSIYKLADKLNMPELKARAFEHIINSLTVETIPYEAFSAFSNQFPEIKRVEVELLLAHWNDIKHGQAMKNVFRLVRQDPERFPAFEEVFESIITNLEYRMPTAHPTISAHASKETVA